jgi:hypothetical protein
MVCFDLAFAGRRDIAIRLDRGAGIAGFAMSAGRSLRSSRSAAVQGFHAHGRTIERAHTDAADDAQGDRQNGKVEVQAGFDGETASFQ